nr:MAG TPA: hypothetical protein [Herelleviridae sp.]
MILYNNDVYIPIVPYICFITNLIATQILLILSN